MDSGVGGISVLKHIHALLPYENLTYFADSSYAPYGNKTQAQIEQRVFAAAQFLHGKNAKALVIACNTATAAAAKSLRTHYLDIPIIGMEPALKPAAAVSSNGIIGVLATVGTLESAQFAALLESYGQQVKVITQSCLGLVECVERGEIYTVQTKALLQQYCAALLAENVDTIVLGCTHYPFVKKLIQEIVGEHVKLIDTGEAVAMQLERKLKEKNLLNNELSSKNIHCWTNSQNKNAAQVIAALWGSQVQVNFLK